MSYFTATHYLIYWAITPEERRHLPQRKRANYAASDQLHKTKPGDILWIVNVYLNDLVLLGRLQIETVVSDTEIAQELVETTEEWVEAKWYAITNKYNVEPMREVDITPLASQLRFNSPSYRLDMGDGRVNPGQLRGLRELTQESAKLLEDIWYNEPDTAPTIQDMIELEEDEAAYSEGKLIIRTLKQRQRNRKLVTHAKEQYRRHDGHMTCQVCGFDFVAVYGIEYIEAHHLTPMSELDEEQETSIEQLAMLCANCHRMIHSRTPPLTVDELRQILENHRGANV